MSKCVKATVSHCYWQSRHSNAQIDTLKGKVALARSHRNSQLTWRFDVHHLSNCLSRDRPLLRFYSYLISFSLSVLLPFFCPFPCTVKHTHTHSSTINKVVNVNKIEKVPKDCHTQTNLSTRMKGATVINIAMHTYPIVFRSFFCDVPPLLCSFFFFFFIFCCCFHPTF